MTAFRVLSNSRPMAHTLTRARVEPIDPREQAAFDATRNTRPPTMREWLERGDRK